MKKLLDFSSKSILVLIASIGLLFISGCSSKISETKTTKSFLVGNNPETINNAKEWIKNDSDNPVPHAILNVVYTEMSDYDLIKKELNLAYNSNEHMRKITSWSSELVKTNGNNPRAHLIKGISFEISGDNQTAITSYLKAIEIDSNCKQAIQSLGNLFLFNNQLDKALIVYTEIKKRYPSSASSYISIGLIHIKKNELNKAVEYFEKGVELEPDDLVSLSNLANLYIETNAKEKAIGVLKRIIKLDPYGEIGQDSHFKLKQLQK